MGLFRFFRKKDKTESTVETSEQPTVTLDNVTEETIPQTETVQPAAPIEISESETTKPDPTDEPIQEQPVIEQPPEPTPQPVVEKHTPETQVEPEPENITPPETEVEEELEEVVIPEPPKASLIERFTSGLSKTRQAFGLGLGKLLFGKKSLDEDLLDELETALLCSDVGVDTTEFILDNLVKTASRQELNDPEALTNLLKSQLLEILQPVEQPLEIRPPKQGPFVLLMVGVNGAGKTTTIGKLAKHMQNAGLKVMLAAGDTFRAAAVEQLQVWGERNNIPVVAQATGADSASVIFDTIQSGTAKKMDVVIADTAGRLHTKHNLMNELSKVVKVIGKFDEAAPHETMLILDAGMGQNALKQAKEFTQTVKVSSISLTKLDGTAKGGIVFAIAKELKLPIRFIGVGEGIDDLREFDAKTFVEALF